MGVGVGRGEGGLFLLFIYLSVLWSWALPMLTTTSGLELPCFSLLSKGLLIIFSFWFNCISHCSSHFCLLYWYYLLYPSKNFSLLLCFYVGWRRCASSCFGFTMIWGSILSLWCVQNAESWVNMQIFVDQHLNQMSWDMWGKGICCGVEGFQFFFSMSYKEMGFLSPGKSACI